MSCISRFRMNTCAALRTNCEMLRGKPKTAAMPSARRATTAPTYYPNMVKDSFLQQPTPHCAVQWLGVMPRLVPKARVARQFHPTAQECSGSRTCIRTSSRPLPAEPEGPPMATPQHTYCMSPGGRASVSPRFDEIVGLRHSGSHTQFQRAPKLLPYRPWQASAGECGTRKPRAHAQKNNKNTRANTSRAFRPAFLARAKHTCCVSLPPVGAVVPATQTRRWRSTRRCGVCALYACAGWHYVSSATCLRRPCCIAAVRVGLCVARGSRRRTHSRS